LDLLILRIGMLLYSIIVIYRLATGADPFYSAMLLPLLGAVALWKLRSEGWAFLRAAFFVQFLFYFLHFFRPVWLVLVNTWILVQLGIISAAFLAGAVLVNRNRSLFANDAELANPRLKVIWAYLLAVSIPFLPFVEQTVGSVVDPRILDNRIEIRAMAVSPDGKRIGVINRRTNSVIHAWEVGAKKIRVLRVARDDETANSLALGGEGSFIAVGRNLAPQTDRHLVLDKLNMDFWNVDSGQRSEFYNEKNFDLKKNTAKLPKGVAISPEMLPVGVAISPDNTSLACATVDKKVEIWDILSGKMTKRMDVGFVLLDFHPLTYSSGGKYLAAEYSLRDVIVWEAATGREIWKLHEGDGAYLRAIVFSPDEKYLAIAVEKPRTGSKNGTHKGYIDIWDMSTGTLFKTLEWDSGVSPSGISFSQDGRQIAAFLETETFVRVFDVASGEEVETLRGPALGKPVVGVAYVINGQYLAVASGQYIKLYDAKKIGK